jgi:hypothetical protein
MTDRDRIRVILTDEECSIAIAAGAIREAKAEGRASNERNIIKGPLRDQLGAVSEMAVAKHLGRYWDGHSVGGADVGRVQVKSTRRHDGNLLVPEQQTPEAGEVYVLCHVTADPVWMRPLPVDLVGWTTGDKIAPLSLVDLGHDRPCRLFPAGELEPPELLVPFLDYAGREQ